MSDLNGVAGVITALAALVVPVGGACAFIWNKLEKRFADIESELEHCRRRERESHERRSVQLTVIELLWYEVRTANPASAALDRAKKLLDGLKPDQAFPLERLPEEFLELARRFDKKD